MDRAVCDRLLLHTGTLSSLYGKEPQTFIRGAQARYLKDSPALDPEAKKSYLDSLNLPIHRPVPATPSTSNNISRQPLLDISDAPALPPKLPSRNNSYTNEVDNSNINKNGLVSSGLGTGLVVPEGDDEDEDSALNPGGNSITTTGEELDSLDPYAALARLSIDGFRSGLHSATGSEGYGYEQQSPMPVSAGLDQSLL